jgi:hypothetical protein
MSIRQSSKTSFTPYVMLCVTLVLVAAVTIYLAHSTTTEEALRADRNIMPLTGPWRFTTGDDMQYALPNYDDSSWEAMDLAAPAGAHDDDVGLSGFVRGWSARGHSNYSGYAWYRLTVPSDSLPGNDLALTAPTAVDDTYQLFINGSLLGNAGDFSGPVPIIHSIQPRMFLLPENIRKEGNITIAFRVWMNSADHGPDGGGIHVAPAIGEKTHLETKYRFQWEQTIKGYIVEVVLPVMFILLAITIFVLNRSGKLTRSSKWFITALVLLGLLRLNQAVYFWFQVENVYQAVFLGTAILRPLMLGSWLMAWWDWFDLEQPKWLPKIITILTLLYTADQLLGLSWVSNSVIHTHYQAVGDLLRLGLLALMLFIIYQGIRKQGAKDLWVLPAVILLLIGLYPSEVSQLNVIPGIWFPYGVGVSRGQFCYAGFVLVMFLVLIVRRRDQFISSALKL